MIDLLLRYCNGSLKHHRDDGSLRIADVGTGSGALGITAQLELPEAAVELLDIDDAALKVAESNVIKFTLGLRALHSDLLSGSSNEYQVLLCNLPYVPDNHGINAAALHEPPIAIFGGPDGLDPYRKLFEQVENMNQQPLLILCESLPPQHEALIAIAAEAGYRQDAEDDFIQAFVPRPS
jgi:release factor glutamine methyltransferase